MNKKKIAALALSGTLLMGAAGFGAYSWFTNQTTVDPNLTISTATLKVSPEDKNDWKIMNSDTSQASIKDGVVTNAQPADTFYKLVKIKNAGTVDEVINVTPNTDVEEQYKGIIHVQVADDKTQTPADQLKNVKIPFGESVTLRIVVGLDGNNMGNKPYNGMKDPIHLNKILNDKLVTVHASQTNHPSVPAPHGEKPADTSTTTNTEK